MGSLTKGSDRLASLVDGDDVVEDETDEAVEEDTASEHAPVRSAQLADGGGSFPAPADLSESLLAPTDLGGGGGDAAAADPSSSPRKRWAKLEGAAAETAVEATAAEEATPTPKDKEEPPNPRSQEVTWGCQCGGISRGGLPAPPDPLDPGPTGAGGRIP